MRATAGRGRLSLPVVSGNYLVVSGRCYLVEWCSVLLDERCVRIGAIPIKKIDDGVIYWEDVEATRGVLVVTYGVSIGVCTGLRELFTYLEGVEKKIN